MKRKHRDLDIFSLSFLDIISCGFGAVVLLVLISSNSDSPIPAAEIEVAALLEQVLSAEKVVKDLQKNIANEIDDVASKELLLLSMQNMSVESKQQQSSTAKLSEKLQEDLAGLALIQSSLSKLKRASNSPKNKIKRDKEVGGIPVDSDYVVFIVARSARHHARGSGQRAPPTCRRGQQGAPRRR